MHQAFSCRSEDRQRRYSLSLGKKCKGKEKEGKNYRDKKIISREVRIGRGGSRKKRRCKKERNGENVVGSEKGIDYNGRYDI